MTNSFSISDAVKNSNETVQLTIILDEESHILNLKPDEVILDAALNAGLDAPYSCQGGVCATCMAKVTDGRAEMIDNSILTDDEIEEGIVLTCQAQAKTAKITVDYDDI